MLSCTTSQNLSSQVIENKPQIEGNFSIAEVDKLGRLYLVNEYNVLIQFDDNFNELFRYSTTRYGEITQLDVSNPMKILVYFGDFHTIVFLDNTLSELKQIFLEELNFWNTQVVCNSNDNRIWLFDQTDKKLIKINENGKVIMESNSLVNLPICEYSMTEIFESENKIYLNADGNGLLVLDNLGSFIKTYDEIKSYSIRKHASKLFYVNKNGEIHMYNGVLKGPELLNIGYKGKNPVDFHISPPFIYVLNTDGLYKKTLDNQTK